MNSLTFSNFFRRFRSLALCLAFIFCIGGQAFGQTSVPLSVGDIFSDREDASLELVRNAAAAQSTSAPFYKSNSVETLTYEGFFKPRDNNSRLALLSDDGASVWIDGEQVLSRKGQNQALDDLNASFHALSKTFIAGRIYHLRVEYTNTIHVNDDDVDGLSLWAYSGGGEIVDLSVSVSATETEICAGGVADSAHQTSVKAVVKDSANAPVSGLSVSFSVENSHEEYPATLTADSSTTNAQGEATTTLTSSRKISSTATVKARVATSEAETSQISMQDAEEVWEINPDELAADGESTASVKLTLKYKNEAVTGHQIAWRINSITNSDGQSFYTANPLSGSTEGYGSIASNTTTTDANGVVEATYTVGTQSGTIQFAAVDSTVVANSPKVRVNIIPLKMNKFYVYTYVGNGLSDGSAGNKVGTRGAMRFYVTLNAIIKQSRTQGKPPVVVMPPQTINFLRKRGGVSDAPLVQGQLKPNPQASDPNIKTLLWEYWAYSPTETNATPSGWDITKLRGKWQISVQFPQPRSFEQQRADFKIDKRDQIVELAKSWVDSDYIEREAAGAKSTLCGGFTALVYESLGLLRADGIAIPSGTNEQHDYLPFDDQGKGAIIFFRSNKKARDDENSPLVPKPWSTGHAAIRDGGDNSKPKPPYEWRINSNSKAYPGTIVHHEPLENSMNNTGSDTDYFDAHSRSSVDLDEN